MPKLPPTKETEIKTAIRDAIVLDPLISIRRLQKILSEKGLRTASGGDLDKDYINRLVRKITRESAEQVNRSEVAPRIAEIKERFRLLYDRLIRIAFFDYTKIEPGMPIPKHKDQIAAINTIIKWDIAILQAEMDAGIFERQLGTLEVEKRSRPIDPEKKANIFSALERWGFIEANAVVVKPNIADGNLLQNTNQHIDQSGLVASP
jgi:hypothetical protein